MASRFFSNAVRSRWGHGVAGIALLAFVGGYYWDYLTGKAFIWEDMIAYYFPVTNYFCAAVAAGRFPFWLSGLLNGVPLYTDFQAAMFYPLRWLLVFFVRDGALSVLAYQWYIVLHILLGGLLMYGYLKSHRLQPLACLLGSLVFCLAGFPALHILHNPMLKVYAWLPLQLWLVDRAVATRRAQYCAGLTLALFVALCAGFPQTMLYDSYLLIAYWLYRRYQTLPASAPRTGPVIGRHLASEGWRISGVFASVLLLGAMLFLPTFEHWRLSTRAGMGLAVAGTQSLPLRNLVQLAVPNFFGFTDFAGRGTNFWGSDLEAPGLMQVGVAPHCYWEFGAYAGQLSLIALVAVVCCRRAWRETPVPFFGMAWAVAVWFMLGRFGGLFNVLYHGLPGVALFRSPSRMASVADCCAAILVAYVVDAATGPTRIRIERAVAVVFGLYAVGLGGGLLVDTWIYPELQATLPAAFAESQLRTFCALCLGTGVLLLALRSRQPLWRWTGGSLLAVLTFVDLHTAYGFFHRGNVHPDQYFDANLWVVETHKEYVRTHGPTRFAQLVDGHLGQCVVDRNLPLIEPSLETPQGYFDLVPRNTAQIRNLRNENVMLDLQNVGLEVNENSQTKEFTATYRPTCLPRVKFYTAVRGYNSDQDILCDLRTGVLDYQRVVAVRTNERGAGWPGPGSATNAATDRVELVQQIPEHYQIRYAVSSPGIIFVSENQYPGWQVTDASGQPVQLISAFVAFKGIVIPKAGQGTLDVRFRPKSFLLGAAITGLTVLGLVGFYGWLFHRNRRRTGVPSAVHRSRPELTQVR